MISKSTLWLAAAGGLAMLLAGPASARVSSGAAALPVTVTEPDGNMLSFGTLRAFEARLKKQGYVCDFDEYEHGVSVACGKPNGEPNVYLDLDKQPSRSPEFLDIDSVRANGRNSGEMPSSGWLDFMKAYSALQPKPAD